MAPVRPPCNGRAARFLALAGIAGATWALLAPGAGAADPPVPDYQFYKDKIAPIVHGICAECHADPGKRLGKHFLRPTQGRRVRESHHRANYRTILGLVTPGDPSKSIWLLKPLGERQGGVAHRGGERIGFDSLEYATMIEWINGARVAIPTATSDSAPLRPPEKVLLAGATVQAEVMEREGAASVSEPAEAEGQVLGPGLAGVVLTRELDVVDEGLYEVSFRARGPGSFTFRIDGQTSDAVVEVPEGPGFAAAGPAYPFDGGEPLLAMRGEISVEGERLSMCGAPDAPASWLSPAEVPHDAVEAVVEVPDEEDGGDDAVLLFDMADPANGRYLALVDGGRRLNIGVVEAGRLRAVASKEAPRAEGPRTLRVEASEGLLVGRLDGKAVVAAPASREDDRGRFGLLTHGRLVVTKAAAVRQFEVHTVRFLGRPVVRLVPGECDLVVELPVGGPSLDSVTLKGFTR
jgi:hypothetical protein